MYQSINIDKATDILKNIIDTNRCSICDKSNGKRMRYSCGHTSCDECVPATESCPICLTPQDSSTFTAPSVDKPYTQRTQNATSLLNAFETGFNVYVYKSHRISEQLKAEKEIFPQCIQAPAKYYNKRKSSKTYTENKENTIKAFPGEQVTLHKMANSNANVQEWLNKNAKRKPLGDLNHSRILNKQPQKILGLQNFARSHKKRNHTEIWADENQPFIEDHVASAKKYSKNSTDEKLYVKGDALTALQKNNNKDDSGISIDDSVIVIDDSQSIKVDKDMNALMAVLEADKCAQYGSSTLGSNVSDPSRKITHSVTLPKVPFYLKSSLSENCYICNNKNKGVNNDIKVSEDQPNVSITIESKSFIAIINVSEAQNSYKKTKQSVQVQANCTNSENIYQGLIDERVVHENNEIIESVLPIPNSSKSEDIFLGEACHFSSVKKFNTSSNVIISESDSEEDVEHSTSLQITADVHRSYDDMVLGDVLDTQEHSKRARRAARGYTPTSTDSSDKENYNPNREKRSYNSKKKSVKK